MKLIDQNQEEHRIHAVGRTIGKSMEPCSLAWLQVQGTLVSYWVSLIEFAHP